MKLALLGVDADAVSLARAAARDPRHDLVWIETGTAAAALADVAPAAARSPAWEALLTGTVADVVIVGRGPDGEVRADQLRKLLQAGVPLVVTHPVIDSMLVYYELEMIREEAHCALLPFLPARWHPAFARLLELLDEWRAGGEHVEQVIFERMLAERTRETVVSQFCRDVDLARALCGELTKVSALSSSTLATQFANLSVQLTNPDGSLLRWSVSSPDDFSGARLTVTSPSRKAVLAMPAGDLPWSLEHTVHGKLQKQTFAGFDPFAAALDKLESLRSGVAVEPDWLDAARTVELAEGVERSLLKGRTIEIQHEEHSEQRSFKGAMTSVGCGLLMASLFVVFVAALASGLGLQQFGFWPYLLVGVFGLFLLMQLLQLVIPPREPDGETLALPSSRKSPD